MTRKEIILALFDLVGAAEEAGEHELSVALESILTWDLPIPERDAKRAFAALDRRLAAAEAGARGGRARTPAKAEAARRNGGKGGRPRKSPAQQIDAAVAKLKLLGDSDRGY